MNDQWYQELPPVIIPNKEAPLNPVTELIVAILATGADIATIAIAATLWAWFPSFERTLTAVTNTRDRRGHQE